MFHYRCIWILILYRCLKSFMGYVFIFTYNVTSMELSINVGVSITLLFLLHLLQLLSFFTNFSLGLSGVLFKIRYYSFVTSITYRHNIIFWILILFRISEKVITVFVFISKPSCFWEKSHLLYTLLLIQYRRRISQTRYRPCSRRYSLSASSLLSLGWFIVCEYIPHHSFFVQPFNSFPSELWYLLNWFRSFRWRIYDLRFCKFVKLAGEVLSCWRPTR